MSGSAVSAGGVKFEWWPGQTDPARVKMRNHFGSGVTFEEACDDMIASIEKELATAKAAKRSLLDNVKVPR